MGTVIDINEAIHHPAQALLPWYVNGTLDPQEKAMVEAHIADCAECRADVEFDRALAAELLAIAPDDDDMSSLPSPAPHVAFLRRRVALGWAVATQLAAAAGFAAVLLWRPAASLPTTQEQPYHVLSAPQPPRTGNVIVLFAPTARQEPIRDVLTRFGARVVDGPTASGAFTLQVPADQREQVVRELRSNPLFVLAEPIGSD